MVCCFIPHLTGLKLQQASLKYFSLIKALCQTTSSDTTACQMTFYINFNPFAPGDFAEKRVLKLVEWFSGHCRAIKS